MGNGMDPADHWGLDIGGTSWRLCRRRGDVITTEASGATQSDPVSTIGEISTCLQSLDRSTRMGCAFAGGLDAVGVVDGWPNRPSWVGYPLMSALEKASGTGVVIADDGVAAALAVQHSRTVDEHDAYLVTTWGTGLGGAAVVGDRVLRPQGRGGRTLGHLPGLDPHQRCRCGSFGCLQTAWNQLSSDSGIHEPWEDGTEVGNRLVDLAEALGLQALVAVGGLLARETVRELLLNVGRHRDFPVVIAASPECVPAVGATYLERES